jgi:exodeoxyribonuclease VII large subunit
MGVEQLDLTFNLGRKHLTVTEFTDMLRGILEEVFPDIWIAGEISGVKIQPSGHIYFTLKDGDAVLSCVCYRNSARFLRFKPQDGAAVLARGRVDIWPPSGRYQLIVEALEPRGRGSLQLAYEQLKQRLSKEGLFDETRKRPLPALPRKIGIVTSPTGAVIQDMLRILESRFAGLHIRLFPALVQGEGSAQQVCRGIEYFSQNPWADVVIVARGGGSLEDLWTFNEESVARAIAASAVPVISAIGHETDYTIADFVADLRAPTPSAAADLVIQSKSRLLDRFQLLETRITQTVRYQVAQQHRKLHQLGVDRVSAAFRRRLGKLIQRTDEADFRLRDSIRTALRNNRRTLDNLRAQLLHQDVRVTLSAASNRQQRLEAALHTAVTRHISRLRTPVMSAHAHLTQLNPLKILERGYAIVLDERGTLIKDAAQAPPATLLDIRFASNSLRAKVEGESKGPTRKPRKKTVES